MKTKTKYKQENTPVKRDSLDGHEIYTRDPQHPRAGRAKHSTGLQGPSRSRSGGPQGNGLGPEKGSGPNPGARACQAAPSPGAPAQHPRPGPAEGLGAGTREDTAVLALHSRATQTTQGGRGPTPGGTACVRLVDGGRLRVVGHNRPVRPHGPLGSPTEGEPGGQEVPPGGLRGAGSHSCRRSALLRGA